MTSITPFSSPQPSVTPFTQTTQSASSAASPSAGTSLQELFSSLPFEVSGNGALGLGAPVNTSDISAIFASLQAQLGQTLEKTRNFAAQATNAKLQTGLNSIFSANASLEEKSQQIIAAGAQEAADNATLTADQTALQSAEKASTNYAALIANTSPSDPNYATYVQDQAAANAQVSQLGGQVALLQTNISGWNAQISVYQGKLSTAQETSAYYAGLVANTPANDPNYGTYVQDEAAANQQAQTYSSEIGVLQGNISNANTQLAANQSSLAMAETTSGTYATLIANTSTSDPNYSNYVAQKAAADQQVNELGGDIATQQTNIADLQLQIQAYQSQIVTLQLAVLNVFAPALPSLTFNKAPQTTIDQGVDQKNTHLAGETFTQPVALMNEINDRDRNRELPQDVVSATAQSGSAAQGVNGDTASATAQNDRVAQVFSGLLAGAGVALSALSELANSLSFSSAEASADNTRLQIPI